MSKNILFSLIGEETIPNYRAYKENPPNILVHVFTDKTKPKSDLLFSLVDKEKTEIISICVNGFDYQSVIEGLNASKLIYSTEDYLSINVTGGTKMMTLALVDYVRSLDIYPNEKIKFFYIDRAQKMNWYLENILEDFCEPLMLEEIVHLQGQKIKSKDLFTDVYNRFSESIEEIKEALNYHSSKNNWDVFNEKVISKIRKEKGLFENKNTNLKEIVNSLSQKGVFNKYEVTWSEKEFLVLLDDIELFRFEHSVSEIEWFVFNAGWFELLTAVYLSKKYSEENIYLNVLFPALSNVEVDKNEVDILINDNGNLIFVECKSGLVFPENINSIKIRQETFGGLIAKNILVLRRYLPKDDKSQVKSKLIEEKCKDLAIEIKLINQL